MFRFDLDSTDLAQSYVHASAFLFPSGRKMLEALRLEPGHHVLDVGCGTGLLADYVSRLVGSTGLVIGIDPLPLRIAIAQKRQRPNLRFSIGTALDLTALAAESFYAAYMHLVFHWLPDQAEALRQLHRVMKPGARLGVTTSARERVNTMEALRADILSRPPYRDFPQAREANHRVTSGELRGLLHDAGFRVTQLDTEPTAAQWSNAEQAIAFSETISAGNLFGHLPEALRQPARSELAASLDTLGAQDAIRVEGARIVAVACRC